MPQVTNVTISLDASKERTKDSGNNYNHYEWDKTESWIPREPIKIMRGHAASFTRAIAIGCGVIIAAGTTNEDGWTLRLP